MWAVLGADSPFVNEDGGYGFGAENVVVPTTSQRRDFNGL